MKAKNLFLNLTYILVLTASALPTSVLAEDESADNQQEAHQVQQPAQLQAEHQQSEHQRVIIPPPPPKTDHAQKRVIPPPPGRSGLQTAAQPKERHTAEQSKEPQSPNQETASNEKPSKKKSSDKKLSEKTVSNKKATPALSQDEKQITKQDSKTDIIPTLEETTQTKKDKTTKPVPSAENPSAKVKKQKTTAIAARKPASKLKSGFYRPKKTCDIYKQPGSQGPAVGEVQAKRKIWVDGHSGSWSKVYRKKGHAFVSNDCLQ